MVGWGSHREDSTMKRMPRTVVPPPRRGRVDRASAVPGDAAPPLAKAARSVAAAWAAMLFLASGCGAEGSGSEAEGAEDAGSGGVADAGPSCPATEPAEGAACDLPAAEYCTYGDRPSCRRLLECLAGAWTIRVQGACPAPDADTCPAAPESGLPCAFERCVYPGSPPMACDCHVDQGDGQMGFDPNSGDRRSACSTPRSGACASAGPAGAPCPLLGLTCEPPTCGPRWQCAATGWTELSWGCLD